MPSMERDAIQDWLNALAAKQPTPGGGAAAALQAAIAAALIGMVTIYTTGPKWTDREARMKQLNKEAAELRAKALALVQADAAAFDQVGAAYRLPKGTPDEKMARTVAIQQALTGAANPPSDIVLLAIRLVEVAEEIADKGNPNVISDVAVASSTARAALEAAIVNIEINEQAITDEPTKKWLKETVDQATKAIKKADTVTERVRKGLAK